MISPAAAPFLSSIILAFVAAFMWRIYRERWLGIWAVAAGLWVLRYGIAVVGNEYRYLPGAHLLPAIAIARGYFILWGAYVLAGRELPDWWKVVFAADVLWLLRDWVIGDSLLFGAPGVTQYALFGGTTMVAGLLLLSRRHVLGAETYIVFSSLFAVGAINLTFPWTSQMPAVAPVLFLVSHAAQLGIGFGALLLFYRRANAERDRAHEKLEEALSKALDGYLPICAHCKAIENEEGDWESLEKYFTQRHDAAFSHGICPSCEVEHYGSLAGVGAAR